jgi:hypothetical protein
VNLDEAKIKFRCHDSYVAIVQSTASTPPGNGFSSSSSHVERRIVFSIVVLIIGHLKQTLEVHLHGALMTNYGLQVLVPGHHPKEPTARHPGRFVHPKVDAADLSQRQPDEVANVPIEGCLNDIEGDGESLLDSDFHEGIGLQGPGDLQQVCR